MGMGMGMGMWMWMMAVPPSVFFHFVLEMGGMKDDVDGGDRKGDWYGL